MTQSMTKNLNITYFTVSIQYNHEKHEKLLRASPVSIQKNLNETPTRQFQKVTVQERNLLR